MLVSGLVYIRKAQETLASPFWNFSGEVASKHAAFRMASPSSFFRIVYLDIGFVSMVLLSNEKST